MPQFDKRSLSEREMTFDLTRILQSKRAYRQRLAARPIEENPAMLDALRARAITLRESRFAAEADGIREGPPTLSGARAGRMKSACCEAFQSAQAAGYSDRLAADEAGLDYLATRIAPKSGVSAEVIAKRLRVENFWPPA